MNDTETSLADLFSELEIRFRDLAHSWNQRKSTGSDAYFGRIAREGREVRLVNFLL